MFYCCVLKQTTGVAMIRFNEKIYRTPEQRQQYDNNVRICYDGAVVVARALPALVCSPTSDAVADNN